MKSKVITNWQPSNLDKRTIRRQFKAMLRQQGINSSPHYLDIRNPKENLEAARYKKPPTQYHKDLLNTYICGTMIVWSNQYSTEVQDRYRHKLRTRHGDVICIENTVERHRMSEQAATARKRWMVRALFNKYKPLWLNEKEGL